MRVLEPNAHGWRLLVAEPSVDLTELEQESITIAAMRNPALVNALGECLDVLHCACEVNRSRGDLDPWFYGRECWRG